MDQTRYFPFYMAYFGNAPALRAEESTEDKEGMGPADPFTEEVIGQEWENVLMQSYYPEQVQMLQRLVEETCDAQDYEGSRIYDEYPDRRMLQRMGEEIAEEAKKRMPDLYETAPDADLREEMQAQWYPGPPHHRAPRWMPPYDLPGGRPPYCQPGGCHPGRNLLSDLAQVLLFQEIGRRRCNRSRCHRYR